jgi:hypothetical protein
MIRCGGPLATIVLALGCDRAETLPHPFMSVEEVEASVTEHLEEHRAEVDAWHAERLERLRAEDGWLTLVGLSWLEEGDNAAGRRADDAVAYAGFPVERVGTFAVAGRAVTFRADAGVAVAGVPPDGRLRTDADAPATVLRIGTCRMHVLARGERFAVRVRDSEAPARRGLAGIERFPFDEAWRIVAAFAPADAVTIPVDSIIGVTDAQPVAGYALFRREGHDVRMVLFPGPRPGRFFVVFADETTGRETYGGGRFLDATLDGDRVELDFNRAYLPPCAFTPYATCPIPPAANRLPFPVRAGETRAGSP